MVARHDLTADSALLEQLLVARRGTAFFARALNELSDSDLDGSSLLAGWNRRHLVAHVGYNARALARLVEWAATGVETPMYESPEQRSAEIDLGATLTPIALRNLFRHSEIHLNVEWRDLPESAWASGVRTAQGRIVPASETVWMRTREVWIHAIDLANGASFRDIPVGVLERLLREIVTAWSSRGDAAGLVVSATDAPDLGDLGDTASDQPTVLAGSLADLVAWASGRNPTGVLDEDGIAVSSPRWL